jgi:hypothetical protein
MHEPDDSTTGLLSLMRRTMLPWEYRHLRAVASLRFAAGGFTLALGLVLLSLGRKAETSQDRRKCYRFAAWTWWLRRCNSLAAIWTCSWPAPFLPAAESA